MDDTTGETELKEVVNNFVRESSELVHITVNGEEITTTPTHPFWVPQKGWTDAIDLPCRGQASTSQWRICDHRAGAA